jgi:hypothetical protein
MFTKNVTPAAIWTYKSECDGHIQYGLLQLKIQNTDQELERNQGSVFIGHMLHHMTARAVTKHCTSSTLAKVKEILLCAQLSTLKTNMPNQMHWKNITSLLFFKIKKFKTNTNARRYKVKVVPVHATKAYRWRRNTAPVILNLSTRQSGVVNTPQPLQPRRTLIPTNS